MATYEHVFVLTNSDVVYPGDPLGGGSNRSAPVAYYRNQLKKQGFGFTKYLTSLDPAFIQPRAGSGEQSCVAMFGGVGGENVDGGLMCDCKVGGKFKDFSKAYKKFCIKMKPLRDKRIFFVNTCNYAHHYSALFSRWSIEHHGTAGNPALILNIDQHCDCSGMKSVTNSTWGNWLFNFHPNRYSPYSAYLAMGTQDWDVKKSWILVAGNSVTKGSINDDAIKVKLAQAVNENKLTTCDVFISIDRDVFDYAYTSFGKGNKTKKYVRQSIIEPVLEALPGYNIVGCDITGLPAKGQIGEGLNTFPGRGASIMDETIDDIIRFRGLIRMKS